MTGAEFTIELLKVLLGTAPVVATAVVVFLLVFKADLRALMRRIASVKFPGGELTTSQAERASEAEGPSPATVGTQESASVTPLGDLNLSQDAQRRLAEFIQAERQRAALWEYRFLHFYLVPHTQEVLDWLSALPQRTTLQMFDAVWTPRIQDPNERRAILNALQNHHLVEVAGQLIEVTEKGKEYREWRGQPPRLAP